MKKRAKTHRGFTLIELLVVIAIIAVIAALATVVFNIVEKKSLIHRAQAERELLVTAIKNYHDTLGYYPPSSGSGTVLTSQLYYELSGTTTNMSNGTTYFTTLDNSSSVSTNTIISAFGIAGFMNCTKGSGDDVINARNFLPSLTPGQIASNGAVNVIVTAVNSDPAYHPLPEFTSLAGYPANPWRYVYPGVNNPNSYDLSLQIMVGGKTYLICNWENNVQTQ